MYHLQLVHNEIGRALLSSQFNSFGWNMEVYVALGGLILQTVVILLGGYGLVLRNDWSNKALEKRMEIMQTELKKLADVVIMQAVQTTRLDNLASQVNSIERRVEDLRRGRGRVVESDDN